MTDVLTREKSGQTQRKPQDDRQRLGRCAYEPKNAKAADNPQKLERGTEQAQNLREERTLPTPGFQTPGLQNWVGETVLSHPVCDSSPGTLIQPLCSTSYPTSD